MELSTAALLAQLGEHTTARFSEKLGALKLSPALAGVIRVVARNPGITQQALAGALRALPSRVVTMVDELEALGFVERRAKAGDRRSYALHLTGKGRGLIAELVKTGREHQQALVAALSEEEQRQLHELLARVAAAQGLIPGAQS